MEELFIIFLLRPNSTLYDNSFREKNAKECFKRPISGVFPHICTEKSDFEVQNCRFDDACWKNFSLSFFYDQIQPCTMDLSRNKAQKKVFTQHMNSRFYMTLLRKNRSSRYKKVILMIYPGRSFHYLSFKTKINHVRWILPGK